MYLDPQPVMEKIRRQEWHYEVECAGKDVFPFNNPCPPILYKLSRDANTLQQVITQHGGKVLVRPHFRPNRYVYVMYCMMYCFFDVRGVCISLLTGHDYVDCINVTGGPMSINDESAS